MTIKELYKALDAYCGVNADRTEDTYKNLNKPIVVYSPCGPWDLGSVHEDSSGEFLVLDSTAICKDIFTCNKWRSPSEVGGGSSLEDRPSESEEDFDCSHKQLTSLNGAPSKVSGGKQ